MQPSVIYQDDTLWALNKPAGLHTVPGKGELALGSAAQWAQQQWPEAAIVHRLDMATSGILLMARGPDWQRVYGRLFEQRAMHKRYEAVVQGVIHPDRGTIDLPLIADWPNRPRQMVDHDRGKPALTHFEVLSRDEASGRTRVALFPVTGRSHQLRVHLLAIGHPILGDTLYGAPAPTGTAPRLHLHACSLSFVHPLTQQTLALDCPCPF